MTTSDLNRQRRQLIAVALMACSGASTSRAHSGANIARIVVPFAAGGAREMPARIIQQDLGKELGQTWIVESKPGAGGAIGTNYVRNAKPDGLTLLMGASSHFVTAALGGKPPYDPVKDFAPVALIGEQSYVLIVQAGLSIKTVAELVAYGKQHPSALNYASAGIASSTHLAGAYFASLGGVKLTHIPFKSTQEAANDVVAGRTQLVFVPASGVGLYVNDSRVRILATTAAKRTSTLPNVQTMAESGLTGYRFESWFGLLAPGKTPPDIVDRINAAVNRVLARPEVKEHLLGFGIEPDPMTVAEFSKVFLNDQALMSRIVKNSGIARD